MTIMLPHRLIKPFTIGNDDRERIAALYGYDLGDGEYRVCAALEVPNRADAPRKSCKAVRSDVDAALAAVGAQRAAQFGYLIGYLHTHPRGAAHPSYNDCQNLGPGKLGVIFHPKTNTITYYTHDGYLSEEQYEEG